jgi:cytoskeletal protein CcmA (bactofilin family)
MRTIGTLVLLLCVTLVLAACGTDGRYGVTLVTEGAHSVAAGETLHGDVVITGGQFAVQPGGRVTGALHILGGAADVDGAVGGNMAILSGALRLGPAARVGGDLLISGGAVERDPAATIAGRVNRSVGLPSVQPRPAPGEQLGWWLFRTVALAALAVLAVQFLPQPTTRVSEALVQHPLVAGAMGVLVGVVGLSLVVLMAFTLVLVPVALLGLLLGGVAVVVGWLAFGVAAGNWLVRWRRMAPATAAFVGTLLALAALELLGALPLIGDLLALAVATAGLGAVVLTRFGTQVFVPDSAAPVVHG